MSPRALAGCAVGAVGAVVLAGCGSGTAGPPPGAPAEDGVRVVAVGDVACAPGEPTTPTTCQHLATADLASRLDPDVVIGLGDLQYETGALADFEASWARSWGRFDDVLAPVPGNHEEFGDQEGYRAYTGSEGHEVREIGGWRVYLADSNCEADGCEAEAAWLADDLAAHPTACTLVATHHPRWSSGAHGPQGFTQPLWDAMVDGGVDVALAAHDHDYERFERLDVTGHASPGGTRQLVVGTGGKSFYDLREQRTGSAFVDNEHFGVLEMVLREDGYDWAFVTTEDEVLDEGTDTCSP